MNLEERLKKAGIEKILVVDDSEENISAAKTYFDEHLKGMVSYAHSEAEAIQEIQEQYQEKKYDLVLSDMQMEEKSSGKKVVFEASKHKAYSIILTAKDAFSHGGKSYDESTTIIGPCIEDHVRTKKSDTRTWPIVTEKVLRHLESKGKATHDAIKRHEKYVGKPSQEIAELMMMSYSFK